MLHSGERQVAPTIDGIRRDHVARYEWVRDQLAPGLRVLDVGCGIGYGANILARAGHKVTAIDRDAEAIAYAKQHYDHPNIRWRCCDTSFVNAYIDDAFDVAICFELVEHLADPLPTLRAIHKAAACLFASVPNETHFPFRNYKFHHRHYTQKEFADLLVRADFELRASRHQRDAASEVGSEPGRTLISVARAAPKQIAHLFATGSDVPYRLHGNDSVIGSSELQADTFCSASPPTIAKVPEHVVILGLGPSLEGYVDLVKRLGGRSAFCDEVWGINAVADVIACDRVFHMDDVRIQELRAKAAPESNIANMLRWLKRHPGPVYTSRPHPDYPGLVAYPLQDVIRSCGFAYFNSTAAYAVAYAVHIGVRRIGLFGFDFTYADSHKAEKGRACVEFHLGIARARGIEIGFPDDTSLMDACSPFEERIYGYDTLDLDMQGGGDEPVTVTATPRPPERWATAAQIEARYDHAKHPNRLVQKGLKT